jgi:hypothetical protein
VAKQLVVGQRTAARRERQLDEFGTVVAPERVRLRGPVEIAERCRKAVVVVLRALVIRNDDFTGGKRGRRGQTRKS